MAVRGSERLSGLVRMLNLLPYFSAHPEHSLMEAAADLGLSPEQLKDDLNRLWCCGRPGMYPHDLVDLDFSYAKVRVLETQGMDKPLRLTHTEAGALLLALENLEQSPGLTDRSAVLSAAAKLRNLMGPSVSAVFDAIATDPERPAPRAATSLDTVREAVDTKRRITFEYHSVNDDSRSQREVSVTRIFSSTEGTYVVGWDHAKDGHRTFRLDRMSHVSATSEASEPHARQLEFDAADPFALSKNGRDVAIRIKREALWLADYVPITVGEHIDDYWHQSTLRVASEKWLIRFVASQGGAIVLAEKDALSSAVASQAESALGAYDCAIGITAP